MFEEICRKTGTIRIPTGEYSDSAPVFDEVEVSYFTMTETFRNADGVQQSADHVYCKGYEQPVPVEAKFIGLIRLIGPPMRDHLSSAEMEKNCFF